MSCCGGTSSNQEPLNNGPTKTSRNILSLMVSGAEFNKKSLFTSIMSRAQSEISSSGLQKLILEEEQLLALYRSPETTFSLDIPGRNGVIYTLRVAETFLYAPEFHVVENETVIDASPGRHYFGIAEGYNNSRVVLNVYENMFSGVLHINEEPIEIVRETVEISTSYMLRIPSERSGPFSCSTDTSQQFRQSVENQIKSRAVSNNCARCYFDVDNSITNFFGGNVATTTAYITDVFANVASTYLNDPDVETVLYLNGMTVYTAPPPFTPDLPNYSQYRTTNQIAGVQIYNFVHFNSLSGIAWLGTFCQPLFGPPQYDGPFTVCGLDSSDVGPTGLNPPYPAYTNTVKVIAHEMGHVFGSNHTFDCVWIGPTGATGQSLGGCRVSGNTGTSNCVGCTASNPNGTCFQPGSLGYLYVSANGSTGMSGQTIMSYCNPIPLVFGPQPGAVIRAAFNGCTGCLVCVHPDTKILLPDGSCEVIRNLKRGDYVAADIDRSKEYRISKINIASYYPDYLMDVVVFEPGSLGVNSPSETTIMTEAHGIFYKGRRRAARLFKNFSGVTYHEQIRADKLFPISKQGMVDIYDLQFDDDGTYVANGIQCQSRCPWSAITPLPKHLYFDTKMYNTDRTYDSINHTVPRDWTIMKTLSEVKNIVKKLVV
jgi:hypothetical protein